MTQTTPDVSPTDSKRVVSPQTLVGLFDTAAEGMLNTGRGQRLGSYVVGYDSHVGIKQHPIRNRVTHAEIVDLSPSGRWVVTHEVHFPSKDKQAGDFDPASARFETHQYDDADVRIDTQRTVLDQVDVHGPELQPYVDKLGEL